VTWQTCTLGDVVKLQRGHDLPERLRVEGAIPVVSSSGITGRHNVAKAEPPGVVTGRYGTIGEVFFLEEPYWPLNTALYVVDFKGNDPRFVAYLLKNTLKNYQSEKAAVPGVDRNVLHLLEVRAPDRQIQERIVSILSTYDDLIENNRRRIALLEEVARMLYREWFIRFRFPGHEHVKVIDGIPAGWERRTLGSILTLKRGYDLPEAQRVTGQIPILSSSGVTGFHNQHKAQGPGVVTGRYGTLGEVYYIEEDYWPLNTALYVRDFQGSHPLIIFHLLMVLLKGITTQKAAVPGVDRNVLHTMMVIWPPLKLRNSFVEIVSDYQEQLRLLGAMNQKLTQARDLLLPRLMSGEIAV